MFYACVASRILKTICLKLRFLKLSGKSLELPTKRFKSVQTQEVNIENTDLGAKKLEIHKNNAKEEENKTPIVLVSSKREL